MKYNFITENFLLENKHSQRLYHDVAKNMPIIDYHCHLPVDEIASNRKFENISQVWLNGDHYKWRAMRTLGVPEDYITGSKSDWEKFLSWAKTVPHTLRNPLFHWTHMELKNPFGIIDTLLDETSAQHVWDICNEQLAQDDFSTQGLIKKFNVSAICTTDDPVDSLEHHRAIKGQRIGTVVLPAFRPDKGMMIETAYIFKPWFEKLQALTSFDISSYELYISALRLRHDFFHANGCRVSDHGIETAYSEAYTSAELESIFQKVSLNKELTPREILQFKSAMMYEFGVMDYEKGWVQQLHLGAQRNNNSRMFRTLGPDTGFDSIGDYSIAAPLAKYLDALDTDNKLAKTILYNLNPRDNELMATMIGNFQDGTVPGKLQYGSGWWFLDQLDGMQKQMNALSVLGLLSQFVGMLTDSRSFLSYPRHDYFRRLLCNIIGTEIEKGLIPDADELVHPLIENICFKNANKYFGLNLPE